MQTMFPATFQPLGKLIVLEDNEGVINMCKKGRAPALRHTPRTFKIDLDLLFERLITGEAIKLRFVRTIRQIADMFTKAQFTNRL